MIKSIFLVFLPKMGVQRMAGHAPFWLKLCTHALVTVDTMKPWYNERLRDWQAMFTIKRCFSLDILLLLGKNNYCSLLIWRILLRRLQYSFVILRFHFCMECNSVKWNCSIVLFLDIVLSWLVSSLSGFEPWKITHASDNFGKLYDFAVELIKRYIYVHVLHVC